MLSKKLQRLRQRLAEIETELKKLEGFRATKALLQFRRQLAGEQSYLKRQIHLQKPRRISAAERRRIASQANRNRSEKMKRTWRYFRAMQENYYPDKNLKEIRSSFKKHREGLETEIPDVAWRNPSP